jgi:branched-chain amino acid aminotransferase
MYYTDTTTLFLNGRWLLAAEASTDLYSQTLHYGNGVFEGIRAYATEDGIRVFKAEEHYERLLQSAKLMHISVDYTVEELVALTYELLEKNNFSNAYIRPLIYLGSNMKLEPTKASNLMLCAWEWGTYLGNDLVKAMWSSYQRPNPKSCHVEAKTVGHYTNSILATTEAKQAGYDEALLCDQNGFVAEASGANFFFEKDGVLYTPPLGNILAGITRATIMEMCAELDFEVREEFFKPAALKAADGAFFTGTAAEVAGLDSISGQGFNLAWEDTMGHMLMRKYKQRVSHREYNDFALV